jgi:hypothetical protein
MPPVAPPVDQETRKEPGGQHPRPNHSVEHAERGTLAVNMIEGTLGQVLLVLAGVAIVLLAVILILLEADYILRLGERLVRRMRTTGLDPSDSHQPTVDRGP